jgi:hypothetical protein
MLHATKRGLARLILASACVAAVGCASITGSWKRVATSPPRAAFPVDQVTFDEHNLYTATGTYEGQKRTSTGRYEYGGSQLRVLNANAEPRVYRARIISGGKLELTYEEHGQKVTAVLERVGP